MRNQTHSLHTFERLFKRPWWRTDGVSVAGRQVLGELADDHGQEQHRSTIRPIALNISECQNFSASLLCLWLWRRTDGVSVAGCQVLGELADDHGQGHQGHQVEDEGGVAVPPHKVADPAQGGREEQDVEPAVQEQVFEGHRVTGRVEPVCAPGLASGMCASASVLVCMCQGLEWMVREK